jgi:TetR/AcrR family transcriptional regulator, cholesterol catabolism regulator
MVSVVTTASRTREAQATSSHARIVAGARKHFFAHGFRRVTMDELAHELGMSKKTLYVSFPGKLDLVRAVIANKAADIGADLERITSDKASDFQTRLSRMLECFQKHIGEIQPAFVRDVRREAPEVFQMIERVRRDLLQRYFGRLLEQGRKAGLVRKDIPVPVIIEVLLGAVESVVNPQKVEALGITPKTALLTVLSVVLEGVLVRKGSSR